MLIEVAVIAPVVSADPRAWTHLPTARSVAAAASVWVKVVVLLTSTLRVVTALVVGLVELTTMVEPLTEVTLPDAPPNPPGRPLPPLAGRDGGVPDPPPVPPPPPPPPPNLPPPPPNPPAQVPLVGVLIRTLVALRGVDGAVVVVVDDPDAGVLNAETHDPTLTLAMLAATVWLNVVVEE
jgi:hypothetical protein